MRKSAKRAASMLTATLITTVLFGCQTQSSTSSNEQSPPSGGTDVAKTGPEALTLPITNEKLTLKFFINLDSKIGASMKSYNEVLAFKEMEKRSGIHIDFQHPPVGQDKEQLNLMLASNTLPDIIYYNWQDIPGGPGKAIGDKSIVKLNEYIDQYAPNLKRVLDSNPEAKKQATLDDGTIYMFPMLWIDPGVRVNNGFQVRKDWLDKLGLPIPQTIDDWYTTLKAFREKDPNGNGDTKDEIPFVSQKNGDFRHFSGAWGLNAVDGFYQVDGKIKYAVMEPQYKDFLTTMAKWYKEGLIDPEYASTDAKMMDSKMTSEKGGAYVGALSANMGRYLGLVTPKNPKFDLAAAPGVTGPAGKPYTNTGVYVKVTPGHGAAVGSKNKNIKETVKWLDYFYSPEGDQLFSWGIEGESFVMKDGKPQFTDKVLKSPDGLPMDQAVGKYAIPHAPIPVVRNKDANWAITTTLPQQIKAVETWNTSDKSLLLPPLSPDQKDSARLASIMNEVRTYESEMLNKIVMGVDPISKYDQGVQNLKSMGIEEAIQIMQTAFDKYQQKK